jgi:hypothetical protein
LRELATVEDSLIKSLTAVYHGRVKYPGQRMSHENEADNPANNTRRSRSKLADRVKRLAPLSCSRASTP